jgi:dephospho-CoA kinase
VRVVGLTGSIGMGKSAALRAFADHGAAVWDADAAVHRLYGPGGAGAEAVARLVPKAVGADGVDRGALCAAIIADPSLLKRVEAVVHPLVAADREAFLAAARDSGARVAVCDIPLLFETGADGRFDSVVVVSAPADAQRSRVLARRGMTEQAFAAILARQTPDAEKRARATHVIDTGGPIEAMRAQVAALMQEWEGRG